MNTKYKLLAISISALLSGAAFAQAVPFNPDAPVSIPTDTTSNVQVGSAQLAGSKVAPPSAGNVYERQVTPYLREISKRKVLLETRKLDAEIEKTEAEILKIQRSKEAAEQAPVTPPTTSTTQPQGQVIAQGTVQLPQPAQAPAQTPSIQQISAEPVSTVRVLMILGYDNDLYAKVSTGQQGGYVVRKGDILPDGRRVSNITSNYIEVSKAKNTKGGQRLYVSGPAPTLNGQPMAQMPGLSQLPTTSMGAGGIPLSMPGLSMTPTTVNMPALPQTGYAGQIQQGGGQIQPQNQTPTVTQQLGITPLR